jgi:two-component system OmpR family sensor kinase
MSLRTRLLLAMMTLVGAGLAVAGVATYRSQSSFLLKRVDEQLRSGQELAVRALVEEGHRFAFGNGSFPGGTGPSPVLPPGTYAAALNPAGRTVSAIVFGFGRGTSTRPLLPSGLPGSMGSRPGSRSLTANASLSSSADFRVLASSLRGGGTLVLAIPLTEVNSTLRQLLLVEFLVGGGVLALMAALALWLVRIGLRPLEGIGQTAGAIAAGDLARRVEPADERTEVGRLGLALNSMLAQIEAAFEERRASENRLRRFVADASHELRTPLTSIRGYAELFHRGADSRPADLAKTMTRIESEAARMGVLVDDLLLLARLDQGRPLERKPVDLVRVVAEAVDASRAIDPSRTIDLRAPQVAEVRGDEGRLRQVVDKLLENVRVHTPGGTPARVHMEEVGDEISLRVADSGPGLPADSSERVFERFYRGDPGRSRETGGAGLGLSIARAIVEAHGGMVTAVQADGSGAEFEVRLPAMASTPDGGAAETDS